MDSLENLFSPLEINELNYPNPFLLQEKGLSQIVSLSEKFFLDGDYGASTFYSEFVYDIFSEKKEDGNKLSKGEKKLYSRSKRIYENSEGEILDLVINYFKKNGFIYQFEQEEAYIEEVSNHRYKDNSLRDYYGIPRRKYTIFMAIDKKQKETLDEIANDIFGCDTKYDSVSFYDDLDEDYEDYEDCDEDEEDDFKS